MCSAAGLWIVVIVALGECGGICYQNITSLGLLAAASSAIWPSPVWLEVEAAMTYVT